MPLHAGDRLRAQWLGGVGLGRPQAVTYFTPTMRGQSSALRVHKPATPAPVHVCVGDYSLHACVGNLASNAPRARSGTRVKLGDVPCVHDQCGRTCV